MGDPDYIVVGAGSAGCVLANRLSENGKYRVTLIEAGGDDRRFFVRMPMGYGKLYFNPSVNWLYRAEPDPGLAGEPDHLPRGKLLGGSSSINAMVYTRGHPEDYEDWGRAARGWGWEEVLAAYRAMEDTEGGGDEWRGAGGPLFVSSTRKGLHWTAERFVEACGEAGLGPNPDFNGATQEGAGFYQLTVKHGQRNSAARAFLRPAMRRANLQVITGAQVTRVVIEGRRAVGVEYVRDGQRHVLRARGEVILSGGAMNTPQLLQLSGIGPGGLLREMGIAVIVENTNVGSHYSDHHGLNYVWEAKVPTLNNRLRPW